MPAQSTYSLTNDGSGEITLASPVTLGAALADYSLSMWVYIDDVNQATACIWLSNSADAGAVLVGLLGNGSSLYLRDDFGVLSTFTVSLSSGTWYHIAFTRVSGTTLHCYVDGVESSSGGQAGVVHSLTFDKVLAYHANMAFTLVGSLDDFAAFTSALTGTQIANIAGTPGTAGSSSLDVATLSPVLLIRMEEGSGDPADSSGNGNDGTISGGVTWSNDVAAPLQAAAGGGSVVPLASYYRQLLRAG